MSSRKRTRLQSLSDTQSGRQAGEAAAQAAHHEHSGVRAWLEALVLAFVLAMFVRVFIFELYKVPTGSMTPTIIGGTIIETDLNGDGREDLGVFHGQTLFRFLRQGDRLVYTDSDTVTEAQYRRWSDAGEIKNEYHRIFVNKFAYWFRQPERGEIIVFKTPEPAFDPTKPLFIKRAVGVPGDIMTFDGEGHLRIENDPAFGRFEFFREHRYKNRLYAPGGTIQRQDYVRYTNLPGDEVRLDEIRLPDDMVYAMGDNTVSSLDSRYWGAVKLERLKGKAFFRYWPLRKMSFLR